MTLTSFGLTGMRMVVVNKSTTGARGTSTFWHEWGVITAIGGGFGLAVLAWAGYELGGMISGSRMGGFRPVQLLIETLSVNGCGLPLRSDVPLGWPDHCLP